MSQVCQNGCGQRPSHSSKSSKGGVPIVVCPGGAQKFGNDPFGDFCPESECLPVPCRVDWSFVSVDQPLVCPDLPEPCPGQCCNQAAAPGGCACKK